MQWHQLDHMQTICTSLQTDNHTNTSSLILYRLDALPEAQPTGVKASKALNDLVLNILINSQRSASSGELSTVL